LAACPVGRAAFALKQSFCAAERHFYVGIVNLLRVRREFNAKLPLKTKENRQKRFTDFV